MNVKSQHSTKLQILMCNMIKQLVSSKPHVPSQKELAD